MEKVGTFNGITFINDAIATTPESTLAAIKTFSPDIGTLFLGGYDSGFIYTELEKDIEQGNIENLILFPDTGYRIFTRDIENKDEEIPFQIKKNGRIINILKTRSMEMAVKFAYEYTKQGKIALLSNASQSFSLWKSYEVKGNLFKELVMKYSK
jgi:UDP-N-acetylmuramoyl-L-alanine---L-glutamate ligase